MNLCVTTVSSHYVVLEIGQIDGIDTFQTIREQLRSFPDDLDIEVLFDEVGSDYDVCTIIVNDTDVQLAISYIKKVVGELLVHGHFITDITDD